jgi:hypothetical protein
VTILYVNGDSHSAGAEAVNDYCFAKDDRLYHGLGRQSHPDNLKVSYGCNIANELSAVLHCDAESASSNNRIIRTTREYIRNEGTPDAVIIGWSTWEREEWLHENVYWQVNAGGVGHDWPDPVKERYKEYIVNLDWELAEQQAHKDIYELHTELLDLKIPHLFFNTYNYFRQSPADWFNNYLGPYDPDLTYYKWLTNSGFQSKPSYHFDADAHRKWAEFLLPHLTQLL